LRGTSFATRIALDSQQNCHAGQAHPWSLFFTPLDAASCVQSLDVCTVRAVLSWVTCMDKNKESPPPTRQEELRAFLLLSVLMAPVVAVLVVSGWGFIVWMYQLFAGPPGPRF
jgi:nitrate reductase NapE